MNQVTTDRIMNNTIFSGVYPGMIEEKAFE